MREVPSETPDESSVISGETEEIWAVVMGFPTAFLTREVGTKTQNKEMHHIPRTMFTITS